MALNIMVENEKGEEEEKYNQEILSLKMKTKQLI